jgi:hypothetical protein
MDVYDGGVKVTKLTILCCFKNDERYLSEFFIPMTLVLERIYNISFSYMIIENNSVDSTRDLLNKFIATKSPDSKLLHFDRKKDYKNTGIGNKYERIHGILDVRNTLLKNLELKSTWSLLIDSNIYFKENIINKMFSISPSSLNIGMMTPYTQQLMIPGIHFTKPSDRTGDVEPILCHHYYDTFSLFVESSRSHYPQCAFEKCDICKQKRKETHNKYDTVPKTVKETEAIVDCDSCFGGFAFIHNDIFNKYAIRWETVSYNSEQESLCEHFLFCYQIRKLANKRVVILQNIDDIYRTT